MDAVNPYAEGVYHRNPFASYKLPIAAAPRVVPRAAKRSTPGLWPLCKEALAVLSGRCMPMLLVGVIGFAGAPVFAALVTLVLSLMGALGHGAASGQFDRLPDGLVVVFAVLLVIAGALARGAITWLALHPDSSVKGACRAAGQRMPALLLVSFGYTLCMALGAAGLSVWLRAGRIDSDWMVYPPSTPAQLQRAVLAQAADALIPDPIAPHTMLFPRVRAFAVNATVNADLLRRLRSTALKDTVVIGVPLGYAPATLEFAGVPLAGLIVIAISEALWRNRIVMVMQAEPHEVLRPFIAALKFGITHFGAVSIRVWGLRLVLCGLCIAGIVMPCMMVCSRLVPLLARLLNLPAVYPISTFVMGTGISFVCALLATFSIVFDVKLVQAIDTN